jgi:hypothetical protein
MNNSTQLLCTFAEQDELDSVLLRIVKNYEVAFDTIYVLQNTDAPLTYCCTYNIFEGSAIGSDIPPATISLHRKKATNTLYTINALNLLVVGLNGGKLDKKFSVPWEDYRNTILVTAYGKLKIIHTKLEKIVKVSDINV